MHHEFQVSHREENDWTIVEVRGEADIYTVPQIREHLNDHIQEGRHRLIVDLRGVKFMDSTGLGMLVAVRKRLFNRNGTVRLVIVDPHIRKLFTLTGLHRVFPIYESVGLAKAGA